MIKFSDFVIACDNDELLEVYHGNKLLAKGSCETFLVSNEFNNFTVNKFFSYDKHDGNGSYIEVQLIK